MISILFKFLRFFKSVRGVLLTAYLYSLHDCNVSIVRAGKPQPSVLFWPIESCSVSRYSLRFRGAMLIFCLIETT